MARGKENGPPLAAHMLFQPRARLKKELSEDRSFTSAMG